ncbi:MAG TPA: hypothetical protein VMW27_29900 [Thermoanaerobaculia bacterium]|nr:hypothetical protein [Thermoanaerobaculia bacterium]
MQDPRESLKSFCNRVAEAAVTEEGARLTRLLRLSGLLGETFQPTSGPATPARSQGSPGRVGIWEGKVEDGRTCFVRSSDMLQDWQHWANVGRIEPKGEKLRVVLIGESVARGYLYDPEFTPAMALERLLENRLGQGKVEVIDLARTDLGFDVGGLALAALQLEPDAAVLFSGNNWTVSLPPQLGDVPQIDGLLREQGVAGLKLFAEEQLDRNVQRLVADISKGYAEKGVPLIWLVPEFNLGDWRDPVTNAPHLPGNANRDWIAQFQAARLALAAGDLAAAAAAAERMVAIDGGVSVAGLYVLAECSQRCGDLEAARRSLELARDAVIWDPSRIVSPRSYGAAQEALRSGVALHEGMLVDLPQVFRDCLEGGIPDRRLFLDYCHLTAEGIRVAMAAAASSVLQALGGAPVPWRELVDDRIAPGPEEEAAASFLAAVHNGHWWQSYDLVRHDCLRAVQQSPAIAEVMTCFIDIQTRRAPMLMCRTAEEIASLGSRQIQQYLLRHNHQQLDPVLIDAITSVLDEAGVHQRARLSQLRRDEHAVARNATDLLDYYYCSAGLQPQEVMWTVLRQEGYVRRRENDYYKAYWAESRFVFVGEEGKPVQLSLACRLPATAPAEETAVLDLNGRPLAGIELGHDWRTWDLSVPGEALRDGLNEVVIHWPLPDFPGQKAFDAVGEELVDEVFPDFFCTFGEIHTFTASAAVDSRQRDGRGS